MGNTHAGLDACKEAYDAPKAVYIVSIIGIFTGVYVTHAMCTEATPGQSVSPF